MKLEEAIEILNNMRSWDCREPDSKCVEAIEIVLSELDSLKFKYQARKDRTDTIITKQEKMIELMSFGLLVPSIGRTSCSYREKGTYCELEAENKRAKRCHKCIIKYYEKKAEESDKNVDD